MTNAPRTIALLAVGLVVASALTACSPGPATFDDRWTDVAAMHRSDDAYLVPGLVEPDARDIRLRNARTGSGTQLTWTSAAGIEREDCRSAALSGTSRLDAPWWPEHPAARGWTCGWWSVFEQGGRYYAWDHREAGGEA